MRVVHAMLRLLGPMTTGELEALCSTYLPELGQSGVQRMLTRMRKARVLIGIPVKGRQRTVFWALPDQGRPADADRRTRHLPVMRERRVLPERREIPATGRSVRESWWTGKDRAAFHDAARRRWES